jgi:putative inorganic carbon (HCO3(-)) transporter
MVVSVILIMADAAAQYFTYEDFLRGFQFSGLRASFCSRNDFGGWLIMLILIFSSILITKQLKGLRSIIKKGLLAGLIVLLIICLILTYSRGAWLGFLTGLSLIGYWYFRSLSYRSKILAYLSGIICLVSILFILPQTVKERIKFIGSIDSNVIRINLWKESLNIIKDFPILGCGLNTYSVVAPNYKIHEGGGIYPHNSFLQMAAETGIVGLVSFIWILVALFRLGFRILNKRKDPLLLGILAGILAFLVQSFFDTNLYALQLVVLFWFMVGFAVSITKIETAN